jgi:uncharacterized protein YjiS (DUF1127 family)
VSQSYFIPEGARAGAVAAGGRALLSRLAWIVVVWLHRRQGRRDLSELDDRLLADVGISRADALSEAGKPFWQTENLSRP